MSPANTRQSLPPLDLPCLSLETHASAARLNRISERLSSIRQQPDYLFDSEPLISTHVVLDFPSSPPNKPQQSQTQYQPIQSLSTNHHQRKPATVLLNVGALLLSAPALYLLFVYVLVGMTNISTAD